MPRPLANARGLLTTTSGDRLTGAHAFALRKSCPGAPCIEHMSAKAYTEESMTVVIRPCEPGLRTKMVQVWMKGRASSSVLVSDLIWFVERCRRHMYAE